MTRPVFQVEAVINFDAAGTVIMARDCTLNKFNTGEYNITLSRSLDASEMAAAVTPTQRNITTMITSTSDLVKQVITSNVPTNPALPPEDTDAGCHVVIYRVAFGDS